MLPSRQGVAAASCLTYPLPHLLHCHELLYSTLTLSHQGWCSLSSHCAAASSLQSAAADVTSRHAAAAAVDSLCWHQPRL